MGLGQAKNNHISKKIFYSAKLVYFLYLETKNNHIKLTADPPNKSTKVSSFCGGFAGAPPAGPLISPPRGTNFLATSFWTGSVKDGRSATSTFGGDQFWRMYLKKRIIVKYDGLGDEELEKIIEKF